MDVAGGTRPRKTVAFEELVEQFGGIANVQLRIAVAKAAAVAKSDRHLVVVAAALAVLVQPRRLDAYERWIGSGDDVLAALEDGRQRIIVDWRRRRRRWRR